MSQASARAFFILLAAATAGSGGDTGEGCDPFPVIAPTGAVLSVAQDIVPIAPVGETLHVCREII